MIDIRAYSTLYVGQSRDIVTRLRCDDSGWGRHRMWEEVLLAAEGGYRGGGGVAVWHLRTLDRAFLDAMEVSLKQELEPSSDGERRVASSEWEWNYRKPDIVLPMKAAYQGDFSGHWGCYAFVAEDADAFWKARHGKFWDEFNKFLDERAPDPW